MSANIERLLQNYPDKQFVRPATKRDALRVLKALSLPDGNSSELSGAVLRGLLDLESQSCPDAGDFSYVFQGMRAILTASYEEISREPSWRAHATSKADTLRPSEALKLRIEALSELSEFPEGATGIVVFALVDLASQSCADAGEFSRAAEQMLTVLTATYEDIARRTKWFG